MSKTPISIRLRADEWDEICLILGFAARNADDIGFITTSRQANKFADIISNRVQESK